MLATGSRLVVSPIRAQCRAGHCRAQRFTASMIHTRDSSDSSELLVSRIQNSDGSCSGVVTVALNRPKTLNSLTESLGVAFQGLMQRLGDDHTVRAVVLTGTGRAFSAGGDFEFLQARMGLSTEENKETMLRFYRSFLSVRDLPVPTIAAINGAAVGAGFCLALACDLRIASRGAKVGLNFTQLGMTPAFGSSKTLVTAAGIQFASRLLLTGEVMASESAHVLAGPGLFMSLADSPAEALSSSLELAKKIAAASPAAVRQGVRLLRKRAEAPEGLEQVIQEEATYQAECFNSADFREGLSATMHHTKALFPDWDGHSA